jgi:hypothetical protein
MNSNLCGLYSRTSKKVNAVLSLLGGPASDSQAWDREKSKLGEGKGEESGDVAGIERWAKNRVEGKTRAAGEDSETRERLRAAAKDQSAQLEGEFTSPDRNL